MLRLGLEPGDRVGIWAPNCAEWTVAQFATAKAGLVYFVQEFPTTVTGKVQKFQMREQMIKELGEPPR